MMSMSDEQVVLHVLRNKSDFYKILMVDRKATAVQIKTAYKQMALKCHPDKNKHTQAAEAFKLVGSANTTLGDPTKRDIYDRAGEAGVQRHERGGGGGGGGMGPRHRHGAQGQRDFFEEFFFGGGPGGGPFHRQQYQQGRQGPQANRQNVRYAEFELNPTLLMLIPLFIFFVLALLLQSSMTDVNNFSGVSGAESGGDFGGVGQATTAMGFRLTPSPEEGFVLRRVTALHGLHVPYYTTRRWAEVMERRRDVLMSTEQEVLRSQRDYLANRCEAETFKHRTRGRKDMPDVCSEYHRFRHAIR